MSNGEHMRKLMTRRFDCSILNFLCNLRTKHLHIFVGKIGMMTCIALNANSPALFGHSKHECPSLLGIKISICQHKQALVLPQLDVLLEIFENLASVELFHFGVSPDPSLHDALVLQLIQGHQRRNVPSFYVSRACFNLHECAPSKEDLGHRFHVVDQHLLEILLMTSLFIGHLLAFIPHFEDYYLVNRPIFTLPLEIRESLRLFLLVF
jgi:hypothetical protein